MQIGRTECKPPLSYPPPLETEWLTHHSHITSVRLRVIVSCRYLHSNCFVTKKIQLPELNYFVENARLFLVNTAVYLAISQDFQ